MKATDLPALNAALNSLSTLLLILGYIFIRQGQQQRHKMTMLGALACSALFLLSYLIYHAQVGSIPYPHLDWTRPLYYGILIPHVILAAVNVPLIAILFRYAWREDFASHRSLARWVWPIWLFVSLSGVVIYYMLYHL